MRVHFAFVTCFVLLAAACGGKMTGGGPGGTGSSSGGSGGSSGSSGGAGSSSGGIGSSSSSGSSSGGIGSSSSSGSSSGGSYCSPLPGCSSSTECPAGDGCNTCYCEDSGWNCTDLACPEDGGIFTDGSSGSCPLSPPTPGSYCPDDGTGCGWESAEGCGVSCDCVNNVWDCSTGLCPPPSCPATPPSSNTACNIIDSTCDYTIGLCGYQCECYPSGIWGCSATLCIDGGGPGDAGFPDDGGIVIDAGNPACPPVEPAESSGCPDDGVVCSYNACPTNCLCASGAWVCAKQVSCP